MAGLDRKVRRQKAALACGMMPPVAWELAAGQQAASSASGRQLHVGPPPEEAKVVAGGEPPLEDRVLQRVVVALLAGAGVLRPLGSGQDLSVSVFESSRLC